MGPECARRLKRLTVIRGVQDHSVRQIDLVEKLFQEAVGGIPKRIEVRVDRRFAILFRHAAPCRLEGRCEELLRFWIRVLVGPMGSPLDQYDEIFLRTPHQRLDVFDRLPITNRQLRSPPGGQVFVDVLEVLPTQEVLQLSVRHLEVNEGGSISGVPCMLIDRRQSGAAGGESAGVLRLQPDAKRQIRKVPSAPRRWSPLRN